jgi:tetratricopeptide (TPR) repeat protein
MRDPEASPRSAVAYRLFLRANQLAPSPQTWQVARDLYLESLREDAEYAPAHAQLGRMHRVLTKYNAESQSDQDAGYGAARAALGRALELAPDLAAAHYHFAQVETDQGYSIAALRRLLTLAERRRNDPELYAGLVLSCRYGGLLEASLAADEIAHRLDPTMPTSVVYTYLARGEYERVLATPVT